MNILIIFFLIILGVILLLIEFTVLPGITIAGIGGTLLLGYSIYLAFVKYGTLAGFLTLGFVVLITPILLVKLFKGKTGEKLMLDTVVGGKANLINEQLVKPGDTGVCISRLAPMGKVKINGETVEAKSTGAFLDPGTPIRVLEVVKSQIIVEPIK
jgi:membrane-bound ClpP family serine protease